LAENAFLFFATVIVSIFIGIGGNWFVTEYIQYKDRLYSEKGEKRTLNEIKKGWQIFLLVLIGILISYAFLMFIAADLMHMEEKPSQVSSNVTLNETNYYYNVSSITIYNNSCNCDIVHLFNPERPNKLM
jgi:fatty acid desaturase